MNRIVFMSLMAVTAESLSRDMAREIPPLYVVIAKHSVMGMHSETIREVLGCSREEMAEVESDDLYKEIRLTIGAIYAQQNQEQTAGLDQLENLAIQKLAERMPHERDPEFILKVLAVTNRATRRQAPANAVLDPSRTSRRTVISLTSRMVKSLQQPGGTEELVVERQMSIHDGSMMTPSFSEVDELLSVSQHKAVLPSARDIKTQSGDFTFDEADRILKDKGF